MVNTDKKENTMTPTELNQQLQSLDTPAALKHVLEQFGSRVALASSMGAEDQVLTHMLKSISPQARVFTLDTGRLHQQTYDLIDRTRNEMGVDLQVYFPAATEVETYVREHGINGFYDSVENRRQCCRIRKLEPLKRALSGLDIWITGLRAEQSVTRTAMELVEWDESHGLFKYNPLLHWSEEQVWEYLREHQVPVNALHREGYPSIGCAPCTRAVKPGEDIRAGRWWWEQPEHKECGLHR
ncbi:phosphoadenylyl-sulfate reductase [Desulfurispirillum indicum]|nr:phosphoadenylyl-sulfate reductase [Desulfurispirillum indicum]UCZ57997.1 phosphoadenylyl-sulfate reductase [Desulfurispirillum indicum]